MLKVVQWGTGVTGQHVARAIHAHPDMKLVGCYVTSPAKNGRDLGDICGIGPIGVIATSDKQAIFAMDADLVMFMTLEEFGLEVPLADLERILSSGKDVVSTAATALIYPKAAGDAAVKRIKSACETGGTTFHATGIHPGWAGDILPLTLSAVSGRVDFLLMQEVMDYSTYPSPVAMYELMGFGAPPHPVPPTEVPLEQIGAFGAPLLMMAEAMGATIEKVVYQLEVAVAPRDYEIAAGTIKQGMVGGKRYSFTAIIAGKPKLKIEHVTRAGAPVPDEWAKGQGWYVTITGAPSWKLSAEIGRDGQDNNNAACLAGAMHAVHAIPYVVASKPGIHTFLELPMIIGKGILGKGVAASPGF
jgi:hypothetical protein